MTYERIAIENLDRCTFTPGSPPKRFARQMAATPENHRLTPRQREYLWQLTINYRRQIRAVGIVDYARWWLGRPKEQIAFEQDIDTDPTDAQKRLMYADWLEERGDELCNAQRWMVERGWYPSLVPCGQSYGPKGTSGCNYEWTLGMDVWGYFCALLKPMGNVYHHRGREAAELWLAESLHKERVRA